MRRPAAWTAIWLRWAEAALGRGQLGKQAGVLLRDGLFRHRQCGHAGCAVFLGADRDQRLAHADQLPVLHQHFGDDTAAVGHDRCDTLVRDDRAGDGLYPRVARQREEDQRRREAAEYEIADQLPFDRNGNRHFARQAILLLLQSFRAEELCHRPEFPPAPVCRCAYCRSVCRPADFSNERLRATVRMYYAAIRMRARSKRQRPFSIANR